MIAALSRAWAMPNACTFSMPPVRALVDRHLEGGVWLDPFARLSPFASRCVTNDLDPSFAADHHEEALEFLRRFAAGSADGVLFDPPFSPSQISRAYRGVGRAVNQRDTSSAFYADRKDEVARVLKPGGKALCFGWNSNGLGAGRGFDLVEVLVVPHGAAHNDTICTVEVKRGGA